MMKTIMLAAAVAVSTPAFAYAGSWNCSASYTVGLGHTFTCGIGGTF